MGKTAKQTHSSFAQTKETLGSIIFALILALVFRGFVGQAFVIPTGSMAPTLNGKHIDHVCSSCGYSFAVGMDRLPVRAQCPNCNHEDLLNGQPIADQGDGIFTLSWPFALGGALGPQRWDVVVFKAPFRIIAEERDGETNYIKRLIGLPGDILEIIDGDVYLGRAEEVSESIRTKLLHTPLPVALTAEEKGELDSKLQISRKAAQAQEALWQIVFDSDFIATKPSARGLIPAWKAAGDAKASHWSVAGRTFRFDGTKPGPESQPGAARQPEYLELSGKDFRDNYGYNCGGGWQIVSDLRLSGTVNWQEGSEGLIQLCLSKRDMLYTIELQPRQGTGRALQAKRDAPQEAQEIQTWTFPAWKKDRPVRVSVANVDRQLEVRLNDRVVWQHGFGMTAGQARLQGYETASPIVRIGASGCKAELSHLLVSRDVYYQDWAPIITVVMNSKGEGRRLYNAYSDKPGWATRENPLLLREKEYFVLGDNSPQSLDSRRWWQIGEHLKNRPEGYRMGTVPADQMIGKAFFVYWPSWYRLWDIPNLRVIPNVGEMRWIQ